MVNLEDFNNAGHELTQALFLRSSPIAFRLIDENEIPEGCVRPGNKDRHYALCQAFSAVRRNRSSLALFKEDHWCLWPLISLRNVELDEEDREYLGPIQFIKDPEKSREFFDREFPMLDGEKRKSGIAVAPLETCTFTPDLVIIYCNPAQLRQLLMAAKYTDAIVPESCFHTVNSCSSAVVPLLNGETDYIVAIPDPGEYERSLCSEDEMIFSVSAQKLGSLTEAITGLDRQGFGHKQLAYDMNLRYPRPKFYNDMFEKWGLMTGTEWSVGERE